MSIQPTLRFVVRPPCANELLAFAAAVAADDAAAALALSYALAGTTLAYASSMPPAERAALDDAIFSAMAGAHAEREKVIRLAADHQIALTDADLASETGEIALAILLRVDARHSGGRHGLN